MTQSKVVPRRARLSVKGLIYHELRRVGRDEPADGNPGCADQLDEPDRRLAVGFHK
jgi:hypothetical protein